jgi:hypothetical protein
MRAERGRPRDILIFFDEAVYFRPELKFASLRLKLDRTSEVDNDHPC